MLGAGSTLLLLFSDVEPVGAPLFSWTLRGDRTERGCDPIAAEPFYRLPGEAFTMRMPADDVLAEGTTTVDVYAALDGLQSISLGTPFVLPNGRDVAVAIAGGQALGQYRVRFELTLSSGEILTLIGPLYLER